MAKRKLLLADDSITIQKIVNLTFAGEGMEVITVGDGDTALEKIASTNPDIVLADVHMPGLNGYQICEGIRENETTKDLPVILLVGSFEPFDINESERIGANGYLTKPFHSIPELISKVSELLGSHNSVDAADPELESPAVSDADDPYKQSFAKTMEIPYGQTIEDEFADAGTDDEIIQISYVDSECEPQPDPGFGTNREDYETPNRNPTASLAAVSNNETDNSVTKREIDDTFLQPFNDHRPETASASTESSFSKERHQSVGEFAADGTLSFNDSNTLELPAKRDDKTFYFTIEGAADVANHTQVVSLSPELIETIAQKVLEKLAQK